MVQAVALGAVLATGSWRAQHGAVLERGTSLGLSGDSRRDSVRTRVCARLACWPCDCENYSITKCDDERRGRCEGIRRKNAPGRRRDAKRGR
jgi:hypothetical protein